MARTTAAPAASLAPRSASALIRQSWVASGSWITWVTRQTVGPFSSLKKVWPPSVAVEENLVVIIPEVGQGRVPSIRVHQDVQRGIAQVGCRLFKLPERLPTIVGGQLHPAEHGGADHRCERPLVAGDRPWWGRWRTLRRQLGGRSDSIRVCQRLPLVEQGRVGLAHGLPQPLDDVVEIWCPVLIGNRVPKDPVGVGEVAQNCALAAL